MMENFLLTHGNAELNIEIIALNKAAASVSRRFEIIRAICRCEDNGKLEVNSSPEWYRDQLKQHLTDIKNDIDQALNASAAQETTHR
jgi:hypothetical protein